MFEEEVLISQIKQHPVLYNSTLSSYRDQNMRNNAWEEISKQLNIPVDDIKTKWSKLRNCYTNALKRRRKNSSLAQSTPWKYEQTMKFLLPYMISRKRRSTSGVDNNVILYDFDSLKEEPCSDDDRPLSRTSSHVSDPIECNVYKSPSPSRQNENDELVDRSSIKVINRLNDVNRKRKYEMDENDYFFLSMSMQLKKLPESDQADIKFKLHKLIYEAEKERLNSV
ncbi:uncharacterized protein LOC119831164 [Zerene cesonia]|uniref:uncharacterized protein LOC119831164 n=1 Tax=Zerene cesonia TaxID=33412 RepID=UPI0018E5692F|nr:uncharacterized protein LOC119831164 [Zerene cesonia]